MEALPGTHRMANDDFERIFGMAGITLRPSESQYDSVQAVNSTARGQR